MKDIKIFLRKKKKKSGNMAVSVTNISQKVKKKSLLSIEKNIIEREKRFHYNHKKVFQFRKFCFLIRKSIRNLWLRARKVTSWNIRSFRKYKEFFRGFRFLKYKKFFSGCIFLDFEVGLKGAGFHFQKYKEFFNLRVKKFHFPKYKELFWGWIFFVFWAWA